MYIQDVTVVAESENYKVVKRISVEYEIVSTKSKYFPQLETEPRHVCSFGGRYNDAMRIFDILSEDYENKKPHVDKSQA